LDFGPPVRGARFFPEHLSLWTFLARHGYGCDRSRIAGSLVKTDGRSICVAQPVDHQKKSRQYLAEAETVEELAKSEDGESHETLLAIAKHWRGLSELSLRLHTGLTSKRPSS
jgi:hypothetical protein